MASEYYEAICDCREVKAVILASRKKNESGTCGVFLSSGNTADTTYPYAQA